MAFSWISVSAGVTITTKDQINEVKTNTDTLAANLGVGLTWNELPVSSGDFTTKAQIQEIQDNLDIVDLNNVCSAENVVRYTTDNPGYDGTVDGTQNSTVDNDQHANYVATQNTGVDNDQHATYDLDQNTGINTDQNTTVYDDLHGTYDNNQNTGYNNDVNGTIYTGNNATAK